jgi:prepilin-type processing-associated H-X9-DG protein
MLLDSYKWWKQTSWKSMKAAHLTDDSLENNIARHLLKANAIFLDGHGVAKSVSFLLSKNSSTDTFWDAEQ